MANEWRRGTFTYDSVGSGHTAQNIINGFTSFLTQNGWVVPGWSSNTLDRYFTRTDYATSDVWNYNGDGPTQKCGIRILWNSGNSRMELYTFLENTAGNGSQKVINSANVIYLTVDNTAPNNYTLIGGEHGLYVEVGRDGNINNLGHGFIGTFTPWPEMYGSKDAQRMWSTQGFCCDLTGALKFSTNRGGTNSYQYLTNDGSGRLFSTSLSPYICRGTNSVYTATIADDRQGYLFHLRNVLSMTWNQGGAVGGIDKWATFGSNYLSGLSNGRYVVSQLLFVPCITTVDCSSGANIATGTTTGGIGGFMYATDPGNFRKVLRFVQLQYDLTPWANITDAVTSTVYRTVLVADGGRTAKIGVQWPDSGNVTTITL